MTQKKNIAVLTVMKVLASLLVIYIHGANIYGYSGLAMPVYFRPFAALAKSSVPVFMAVSGYLMFRKPILWRENLIKKTRRLAVPFLIWSVVWIVFELAGHAVMLERFSDVLSWTPVQLVRAVFGIPFAAGPLYSPLWYVRELFILSIAAPLFQKAMSRRPAVFLVLAVVVWFSPCGEHVRQSVTFFFAGGVMACSDQYLETLRKTTLEREGVWIFLLAVVCAIPRVEMLWRLSVMAMVIFVYLLCKTAAQKPRAQGLCDKLIAYTFIIYVTHGKFLSIVQILYTAKFTGQTAVNLGYLLIPALMFCVCLAVAVAFRKLLPRLYRICNGEG